MSRYQIWNKVDNIITPSGAQFSAIEWANQYPWSKLPGVKMVITTPPINGGCALEYGGMVEQYKKMGCVIDDTMSDNEVLSAIEDFEDNPPYADEPSNEERIAAAMEAQVLLMSPSEMSLNENASSGVGNVGKSPAYNRIKRNYSRGLWSSSLVNAAFSAGQINSAEVTDILG